MNIVTIFCVYYFLESVMIFKIPLNLLFYVYDRIVIELFKTFMIFVNLLDVKNK